MLKVQCLNEERLFYKTYLIFVLYLRRCRRYELHFSEKLRDIKTNNREKFNVNVLFCLILGFYQVEREQ